MATRKRWKGYGRGGDGPSTHDPTFLAAHKAFARGQADEPEVEEEIEIVEIETVSGPRRVWSDRVSEYEEVLET